MMDHHTVAAISIAGSCLDVLGSLYLAYDLLGGKHGPLRLLTRAVTYSIVYGVGMGLGFGLFFGLVAGITFGVTASIEINRPARGLAQYSLPSEALFSFIRGTAFAVGLYPVVGSKFALTFGAIVIVGQIFGYSRGISPAMDYSAERRPRLTTRQFWSTVIRTFGYCATALFCGTIFHHEEHLWSLAIRVGIVTGLVSGVGQAINPYIEYYADTLPERWLGAFGIGLIFIGFTLQSLQYWLVLFDVHLT